MLRSDSIKSLVKALVLAKSKMVAPTKDATNPHFKSKYADLGSVKASYQPALEAAGLSIISALGLKETVLTLTTTVVHAESAEFIASDFPIPTGLKAQEIGSAVTYGRRYNASCLLDIVAEDDDDGNAASKTDKAEKPAKEAKPAAAPAAAPKPSELTNDQIMAVQGVAKRAGFKNSAELAPILRGLCPGVTKASELSRDEFPAVLQALEAMARRKELEAAEATA